MRLLIPAHQSFFQFCQLVYVDWAYIDTRAKAPKLLKEFRSPRRVPVDFHVCYAMQMNYHSIARISNIVPRPTNICHPFKGFNRLAISLSVSRSRDNIHIVLFQKQCSENLIGNGRYSDGLPKGVHFEQFKNKCLNEQHVCLSTLTSSV